VFQELSPGRCAHQQQPVLSKVNVIEPARTSDQIRGSFMVTVPLMVQRPGLRLSADDGSKDVFVHVSAVRAGIGNLQEGQKLSYEHRRSPGERFRQSVSRQPNSDAPMRPSHWTQSPHVRAQVCRRAERTILPQLASRQNDRSQFTIVRLCPNTGNTPNIASRARGMGTNAWSRRTGSIGCGWDRQVVDGDHLQPVRVVDDPEVRAADQPFQVTISMPPIGARPPGARVGLRS
jgi:cold shock CspA family protein